MIEAAKDAAVLQPARIGAAGESLRRRINRRNLLAAIGIALLFHILIVSGFWLIDRMRIRDIGEWSGPILVKIGVPDAAESPAADPGVLPEQQDEPQDIPVLENTSETVPEAVPEESTSTQPDNTADSTRPQEDKPVSDSSTSESRPAPEPVPARVMGSEDGNNYLIDFEGSDGEVGRTMGVYILDYMPLPEVIEAHLMDAITVPENSKYLSPELIRDEILKYWEPVQGKYIKRRGSAGVVPLEDRPYYWSRLRKYLNYNMADADWRSSNMRPVVIEFTVNPSTGARGAELTKIDIVTHTNDPQIDEAILYGLIRGVYFNDTEKPIKGRIKYEFDR